MGVRRTGAAALALLAGTAGAAVLLADRFHLGVVATGVGILGGLPGLFLAWATYRDGSESKGSAADGARGRPAGRWDPVALGVHRVVGGGPQPWYFRRPHDDLLRAVLDPSVTASRLVVVRGSSSTGKTRAAYQAVQDCLPSWRLDYPLTAAALGERLDAGIKRRTVLWLGQLRLYVDADGGPAQLVRLAEQLDGGSQVIVITTLWPEHWHAYLAASKSTSEPAPAGPAEVIGRLLQRLPELTGLGAVAAPSLGGVIDVPDRFTPEQVSLAARCDDPMLRAAVSAARAAGSEGQITQYLAGVHDLLEQYEGCGGDPYGQAILTAAVDASRFGLTGPCPAQMLKDAAPGYLTDQQRTEDVSLWWGSALRYATRELSGAVRALEPVPPAYGTGVAGYRIAGYLDQHGRRAREDLPAPASLWDAFVTCAGSCNDLSRLGGAARDRGMYRHAMLLWTKAVIAGSISAARRLINLVRQLCPGQAADAARWAIGHVDIGDLSSAGDLSSVDLLLKAVRETGADDAVTSLGNRAARRVSLRRPEDVALLLQALRRAGTTDAVNTLLARDPASYVSLEDPGNVAYLLRALRGSDGAVAALLARDPAAQASLENARGVGALIEALFDAEAHGAVATLASRAVSHTRLGNPWDLALLLEALVAVRADAEVVALLARDPAANASISSAGSVGRLLQALRSAGADYAVSTLASRAARQARLHDPFEVGGLLKGLREAGTDDAVASLLARAPAAHVRLGEGPIGISSVVMLLKELREAGADDAMTTLAGRAARQASLDNPHLIAALLKTLREVGAGDAAAILLVRDPADHADFDEDLADYGASWLIRELREAGANDAATRFAIRAASNIGFDHPLAVAQLLEALRDAGADHAVKILRTRNPAANARLGVPTWALTADSGVTALLEALRVIGDDDAVTVLANRAAEAGLFSAFLKIHPDNSLKFKFGREPSGLPSPPWEWQTPVSA